MRLCFISVFVLIISKDNFHCIALIILKVNDLCNAVLKKLFTI